MVKGLFSKIIFVFAILCLPMAGQCLEVCQLFIHEPEGKVESFTDSIFETVFRLGRQAVTLGADADPSFLSRRLTLDEKNLLDEKGYTLIPKKMTFDLLGLVTLQEDNDLALRKHRDQTDVLFTFQEDGRKIHSFTFEEIDHVPNCKELLAQINGFRQYRPFVTRALNERTSKDSSLGKEIMYWEALEALKIGLSIPDHNLNHSIEAYARLREDLQQILENSLGGEDLGLTELQKDHPELDPKDVHELERLMILDKLNQLRVHILRSGLTNYGAGRASMANYFGGEPANCVANTSVIFSLYSDLGIRLPSGYRLGVQFFTDHLQPILFDQRNNQVINLLSNEISTEPSGQIINKVGYQKLLILKAKEELFYSDPIRAALLNESDYILGFEERNSEYPELDLENLKEKAVRSPIAANLLRTRIDAFAYSFVGATEGSNGSTPFSSNMSYLIDKDYKFIDRDKDNSQDGFMDTTRAHSGLLNEELVERVSDFLLPQEAEDFKRLSRLEPTVEPVENYLSFSLIQRFKNSHSNHLFNSVLIPLEFITQTEAEAFNDYDLPISSFQFLPRLVHKNSRPGRTLDTYVVVYSPEDEHLFKNRPILEQYENLIGRAKVHLDTLGEASLKVKEALGKSSTLYDLLLSNVEFGEYLDETQPWFDLWKNNLEDFRKDRHTIERLTGYNSMPEFMAENGFPLITLRHQLVGAYNQFYESSRSQMKSTIAEMDRLPNEQLKKFAQRIKLITEFVFSIDELYWHHQKDMPHYLPSHREIKIFIPLNQMLLEYFVRNKSYYFTTEASEDEKLRYSELGLDELAEANNNNSLTSNSPELNLPEIDLPNYPGGEDICKNHSGIVSLSGGIAIECPSLEPSATESAYLDPQRKTVLLKPGTIAAIISQANWYDLIKTPNLLMLHYSLRETVLPFLQRDEFGDWGPTNFPTTGTQNTILLFSALIDLMQNTIVGYRETDLQAHLGIDTSLLGNGVITHAISQVLGQGAPPTFSPSELDQLRKDFEINTTAFLQMKSLQEEGKSQLIENSPRLQPAYHFNKHVVLRGGSIPTVFLDSDELFNLDRRLFISSQFKPSQIDILQIYGESVDRMFDGLRSQTNPEILEFSLPAQVYFYDHMERGSYWDKEFIFSNVRSFFYKNVLYQSDSVLFGHQNLFNSPEDLLDAYSSGNLIHIRLPDRELLTKKYETYRYYRSLGLEGNIDFQSNEEHEDSLL